MAEETNIEFEPITTQEEFNKRLVDRLNQKERSVKRDYEGYTSPADLEKIKTEYQNKINKLNSQISANSEKYADYDAKIAEYEATISQMKSDEYKASLLREKGISADYISNIAGTTEEEIKESVEKLAKLRGNVTMPTASTEESGGSSGNKVYLDILHNLKGE